MTDLINNEFYITPKSHVANMTFRRSNCSYLVIAKIIIVVEGKGETSIY